jgi:hypothetical protein
MSRPIGFGFVPARPDFSGTGPRAEIVQMYRPLRRVLAFTRRTIDDVVNCPIAKREVLGFYKLHRQVERSIEQTDLECQWMQPAALRARR